MNVRSSETTLAPWQILLNILTNYAGKFVVLGTWFFLTPFILQRVGASGYGIWILVGSLVSYGSLFDFGIGGGITKFVAEFHGSGEYEQAHSLVATTLWLYTFLGLMVILISAVLAPFFPALFNLPPSESINASWIIFFSGVGLGISLPSGTTIAVLRGLHRFDLVNLLSITGTLAYALMVAVVLQRGGGLVGMALANIPLTLLMQVPAVWLIYRIAPELRFGWHDPQLKYVRSVTSFSSALFVIEIAGQLRTRVDEIIIGAFLPVRAVTPYYFAHRLSELPQIVTDQFMKVLMPLASQLNSRNDQTGLNQLYLLSTRITLAIFLGVGSCLVVLAEPFLEIWVGVEYSQYSWLVYILTAASLAETITWPAGAVLQGMSKHHALAPIAIGSGIANLVLSILFVRPFGLFGIALATLIPNTIEGMFLVLPYTLSVLKISWGTLLKEIVLPILVPSILLIIMLLFLRESVKITSFISIGLIGGVSILVYIILYMSFGKNLQERKIMFEMAGRAYKSGKAKLGS